MRNFSVTVLTSAWWWRLQCSGASYAHCAHSIIRPWSSDHHQSINLRLPTVQSSSGLHGIHRTDNGHRPIQTVHWHPKLFFLCTCIKNIERVHVGCRISDEENWHKMSNPKSTSADIEQHPPSPPNYHQTSDPTSQSYSVRSAWTHIIELSASVVCRHFQPTLQTNTTTSTMTTKDHFIHIHTINHITSEYNGRQELGLVHNWLLKHHRNSHKSLHSPSQLTVISGRTSSKVQHYAMSESVGWSVCPSHWWVMSTRLKILKYFLNYTIGGCFVSWGQILQPWIALKTHPPPVEGENWTHDPQYLAR